MCCRLNLNVLGNALNSFQSIVYARVIFCLFSLAYAFNSA